MDDIKTIHFVGIKGVGMAALAILAKQMGYQVSGSDEGSVFVTDEELKKAGILVTEFDPNNLQSRPDLVVCSAAYSKENIEIKEARRRHQEIISYSEALARLSKDSRVIAVSGIHGKTTTTAMIAFVLTRANLDPSFVVGAANVKSLKQSSHFGQGDFFVLEADEYKKSQENPVSKFLDLSPEMEVITSIELDHPDMFATEEDVFKVFYDFACRTPRKGFIVLCADYPKARKLSRSIADRNFETYGFSSDAMWQVTNVSESDGKTTFEIAHEGRKIGPFTLKMPGQGNILNATAAAVVASKLGVSEKQIIKSLQEFEGVKRRYEIIDQIGNITLIDDYAHHPRAIALTLDAIKARYPQAKIFCIFQPHTYSRTKALLGDFANAFSVADKVIVTDIYASAREMEATISGQDLALEIRKKKPSVKYIDEWDKIVEEITLNLKGPAVVVTMGAGDIYKLQDQIRKALKNG